MQILRSTYATYSMQSRPCEQNKQFNSINVYEVSAGLHVFRA